MATIDQPTRATGSPARPCGGALVDLLYLHDLLPDFDPDNPQAFLSDHRLSASIAHLSRLGDVSIGMCSAWEFCEL